MNILGINPGHNGSVALISNGETIYYSEEERLSKHKYDSNPFRGMLEILKNYKIDHLAMAGTGDLQYPKVNWTEEDLFTCLVRKFNNKFEATNFCNVHHKGHAACAFYNSGFEKALVVIVDGAGSYYKIDESSTGIRLQGYEAESLWLCEYPAKFTCLRVNYGDNYCTPMNDGERYFGDSVTITKAYEAVSHFLGFNFIEAGKTMGLSSYGKEDKNIPNLLYNGRGNKNLFHPVYPAGAMVNCSLKDDSLYVGRDADEWHKDPSKLTEFEKNIAWKIQQESQIEVGNLIEEGIKKTGVTNVAIAGGYGLNCVANYYFKDRFKDINLYCEPISHDGGTAIGVAKLVWHEKTEDLTIRPQKSIYYGTKYKDDDILKVINNLDDFEKTTVNYEDVAKLIFERNIVCIFQGRSEAGPRALGNRSILYDPSDPNGKDTVNKVKGREWFRPFAGSILEENANEWFDMKGLDSSPFMMYAVNVLDDKVDKIPCITHVDKTCRIQTVNREQNLHYYNLIKEFYNLSGIPILFNTSFNLAGDPLVETIDDAIKSMRDSDLKLLYLPELNMLLTKK